jgi:hypothetical protein
MTRERQNISVEGIVAARDKQPYVVVRIDDARAQLSLATARHIANDILLQATRIEADAMMVKFFDRVDFPDGGGYKPPPQTQQRLGNRSQARKPRMYRTQLIPPHLPDEVDD